MDKVLPKKKPALKRAKKKKQKVDYSYPKIVPREKSIKLKYTLGGVCASLKNSQQIVPGNTKLLDKLNRINTMIASMENQGEQFHDQIVQLREQLQEINERLVKSEDKARKHWLIQCERYRQWLLKVTPPFRDWMADMTTKHNLVFPVGMINLKILFYFPSLHRRDGPNKAQAIFDMLKFIKLIPDDQWTTVAKCTWECSLYRPIPRTEIYITIIDRYRSLWSDYMAEAPRARNYGKGSLGVMHIADQEALDTDLK